MKAIYKILLILGFLLTHVQANPLAKNDVPEPLKPWIEWVLYAQDQHNCAHAYNSQQRFCTWPSALKLDLDNKQGKFSQQWQVQAESWVRLPGNDQQWPHDVEVDSIAAVVVNRQGFPVVQLQPGKHKISGEFQWDSLPESLTIPPATGLLQITRNGVAIDSPRINQQGQLWLNKSLQKKDVQDALDVQVYRKISDGHPMRVVTRLILHVSGQSRDVVFPHLQLADFTPLELNSPLPARINQQGDLHLQVRSGNWIVDLVSYRSKMVNKLALPELTLKPKTISKSQVNLPKQEVWVFQANPSLRLTQISGVPAVDSRQTRLPKRWLRYPAYLLEAGQTMTFKTLQRGNASPEPNRLTLQRSLWMDFAGKGYTLQDKISGTMTRGWRLESAPSIQLGSVRIDDEPQFITTLQKGVENKTTNHAEMNLQKTQETGVEVRRGQVNLEAASRYTESLSRIPISGWKHDFQRVNTRLYLAPGWKLFSAHGADNLPNTWLQSWTLLDLFMVLIIAVAIARLWDWKWGIFALITMTLIWHEPGAPKYIWLNLIAAIALLRVLPNGFAKQTVSWYRNATLLALLLIVIPFIVTEVRHGLYPQLGLYADYDSRVGFSQYSLDDNVSAHKKSNQSMDSFSAPSPVSSVNKKATRNIMQQSKMKNNIQIANQMVDPTANIQTGPGLPTWNWQVIDFNWDNPVNENQMLQLNLISPGINLALNFLRVILLLILIGRLIQAVSKHIKPGKPGKFLHGFLKNTSTNKAVNNMKMLGFLVILVSSATLTPFNTVLAGGKLDSLMSTPSEALLQTLQDRLLAKDECLPECAQIEAMRLKLSEQQLSIYLKVHSAAKLAIPLPGNSELWRPEHVLLANQPAQSLTRDDDGVLWLGIEKGIHNVVMQGRLPKQQQLQLPLPLRPKYVEWQGEGWTVEGIRDNHIPSQQLQLVRKQNTTSLASEQLTTDNNYLPPLLHIVRTLHLGLDWIVDTKVIRLSPTGSPISMKIPLLGDESVLSNTYTVKNGNLLLNLSSTQRSIEWQSQIPVKDQLNLAATQTSGLLESWKLDISPIWHIETTGIPVVHQGNQTSIWLPEWQPWPGEKVTLNITRPQGITTGRTITIERSILTTKVGKRLRETELTLQLRSSRGGQHPITLPDNTELISVTIDGKLQPVRQQQNTVSLPIVPGAQRIVVKWRTDKPISNHLKILPVNVGIDNVNNSIHLQTGRDRWVLFTKGPTMGPAVLFWGVLLVILLASVILGQIKQSPLKTWQWFLLGTGLSLATPIMIIVVVGWLLALNYRPQLQQVKSRFIFNAGQVLLVLLTLVALSALMVALQQGLLGWPDMQIAGNGSNAWELKWYQDRSNAELPQPWVLSVPLLIYRVLMLLWALWLAFSLIDWLRQGWNNFSEGGLWRPSEEKTETKPVA